MLLIRMLVGYFSERLSKNGLHRRGNSSLIEKCELEGSPRCQGGPTLKIAQGPRHLLTNSLFHDLRC